MSRQPELVLHREPGAELEQRLTVSSVELVENRPPRGRRKRVEDIAQYGDHRQAAACLWGDAAVASTRAACSSSNPSMCSKPMLTSVPRRSEMVKCVA